MEGDVRQNEMKIAQTLKQRRHWPLLALGLLLLIHLAYFTCPELFLKCQVLFWNFGKITSEPSIVGLMSLEILCIIAVTAIWILSVFVTWSALRRSRKKAYIFILAYFLLPLVVDPTRLIYQHLEAARRAQETHSEKLNTLTDYKSDGAATTPVAGHINYRIFFPIGPLLLLAGVWFLRRDEKLKEDEPGTPPNPHSPSAQGAGGR